MADSYDNDWGDVLAAKGRRVAELDERLFEEGRGAPYWVWAGETHEAHVILRDVAAWLGEELHLDHRQALDLLVGRHTLEEVLAGDTMVRATLAIEAARAS